MIYYDDEREVIATNVNACGLQMQSHKDKLSSNEVFEWPSLHIEHTITHNKTILTRTFLRVSQRGAHVGFSQSAKHIPTSLQQYLRE